MDGFVIGFVCAIGWLPVIFGAWMVRSAFSVPLALGDG